MHFWRIEKMKRLTILIVILTCFTALCLGQRRIRAVTQKVIQLTRPKTVGKLSFEEALSKQQDTFIFTGQTIERVRIGQLAWAAQGVRETQTNLQTVPSTEEASPIQLYLATNEGLFVYLPDENSLEQTIYQDIRDTLTAASAPMANSIASAGCVFIITTPTRRLSTQRGANSRTSVHLQAGHIAQNIQLQAICLDLGSVAIDTFDTRGVNTACRLPRNIEPIYIICVGYPASQSTSEAGGGEGTTLKRAAVIVPSTNFRDEEFFETIKALDAASVQKVIASTRTGIIRGTLGGSFEADTLVNQLKVDDYDALIFIGGAGVIEYVFNPVALNLIREAFDKRKIIAATSTAPSILANAGILKGVKVTSFFSEREVLTQAGAVHTGMPIEQDMKIITSSGPDVAVPFARTLVDAITGR
jgi:protease I